MREEVIQELKESAKVKELVAQRYAEEITKVAQFIIEAYQKGGKVVLFGNGGSAADAQHIAAELVGRFLKERRALPAIALTTDTSILTAVGNDYGYEQIFSRQVEALVGKEDVVIGISTSGNSPNVLAGIRKAKEIGARTVGLGGRDGGRLNSLVDISIVVPAEKSARIQEAHITIGHILCRLVEKELFKGV